MQDEVSLSSLPLPVRPSVVKHQHRLPKGLVLSPAHTHTHKAWRATGSRSLEQGLSLLRKLRVRRCHDNVPCCVQVRTPLLLRDGGGIPCLMPSEPGLLLFLGGICCSLTVGVSYLVYVVVISRGRGRSVVFLPPYQSSPACPFLGLDGWSGVSVPKWVYVLVLAVSSERWWLDTNTLPFPSLNLSPFRPPHR